jgi:starch phosphorylase
MADDTLKEFKEKFEKAPVAFFSAEYALLDNRCLYAGGLGVLAGDYVLEIAEQALGGSVVAIGLFYHQQHGQNFKEGFVPPTPEECGLKLVADAEGVPVTASLLIGEREVSLRAWQYIKGDAVLYFLDTRHEGNHSDDQALCDTLYAEDRETRLKQEFILGAGGMKMLEALDIHPSVYHLNEGNSALLSLELIHHEMETRGVDFSEAVSLAQQHIVFTNHTLVPAGQEQYAPFMLEKVVGPYVKTMGVDFNAFADLGIAESTGTFSMTALALKMAHKVNAVSLLHSIKAKEMWKGCNVEDVTNGIAISRWDRIGGEDLGDEASDGSSASNMVVEHGKNKAMLLAVIQEKTGTLFSPDTLLVGWARRLVEYKRPLALLGDIERIKKLNVCIVYSGPVHGPSKHENEYVSQIEQLSEGELKGKLVFLPHYDLELSKLLVSGTDVWLNTPEVGKEACGTSGMKAALNGSLPLTTNDGWIYETDLSGIGWIVDEVNLTESLLNVLEREIIPLYQQYVHNGAHRVAEDSEWAKRMVRSRALIQEKFSSARALREYVEKLYLPTYEAGKDR